MFRFALSASLFLVLAQLAFAAPTEFRYEPPVGTKATSVSVRGSFNDWGEAQMAEQTDGTWSVTLDLAGEATYKYFINGQWPSDMSTGRAGGPLDPDAENYVDDGFGGKNAVRQIAGNAATVAPLFPVAPAPVLPRDTARVHYHRPDGSYRGWGLHTWLDAAAPTDWSAPLTPSGQTAWGIYWDVPLQSDAARLGFIIHNADNKDPGADQFLAIEDAQMEGWVVSGQSQMFAQRPEVSRFALGDISQLQAHWVDARTVLWNAGPGAKAVRLHASANASLGVAGEGIGKIDGNASSSGPESGRTDPAGHDDSADRMGATLDDTHTVVELTPLASGVPAGVRRKFPHLAGLTAWQMSEADASMNGDYLRGQILLSAHDAAGKTIRVSGIQIPGVLDDLYAYDGPLGVEWRATTPSLHVWAPTAREVRLLLFVDPTSPSPVETVPMSRDGAHGVWSATGAPGWNGLFYLYEVDVFVPSTGKIERNRVTDPYSRSLSRNSERSQIVDMNDPALIPDGWGRDPKPALGAPEDIVLYELHVRDFSALDESTPPELRGTFLAFTLDTAPTRHLRKLAEAGLTHVHILPSFDIATVNENRAEWPPQLAGSFPPAADQQQSAVMAVRGDDGFNWGYDPYHFGVPEGSYSTDPDGPVRIREFRQMVQSLQGMGLRVIMDVVYNHTNESGQSPRSVFDRIVPGYYHRLDENGNVQTSTCCENTASEHVMMERFIGDDLVHWARDFHVDGFRFDLMGHHMKSNLLNWQDRLESLRMDTDGVDGSSIFLYGEGWDFGEVQGGKRGPNATQGNLAGTGIGTFNDRIRDAIRGGNPFGDRREQGFVTGLYVEPAFNGGTNAEKQRLLESMDRIRIGLAGNLAAYRFLGRDGRETTGAAVGNTGYARDPQESIQYVSAHDNETLFDKILYSTPASLSLADRARMQTVALSIVALSQGVPFFHAGSEILRSKCFDADSYDSGDWFNRLDFTYATNNFGHGLPPAEKNRDRWGVIGPLLADEALDPSPAQIASARDRFETYLRVRASSPLFRLRDAAEVQARVRFHNTGPEQIPGLIVMTISDDVTSTRPDGSAFASLDREHKRIVVLFNAGPESQIWGHSSLAGRGFQLHPAMAESGDDIAKASAFEQASGRFTVPARTTAVFIEPR